MGQPASGRGGSVRRRGRSRDAGDGTVAQTPADPRRSAHPPTHRSHARTDASRIVSTTSLQRSLPPSYRYTRHTRHIHRIRHRCRSRSAAPSRPARTRASRRIGSCRRNRRNAVTAVWVRAGEGWFAEALATYVLGRLWNPLRVLRPCHALGPLHPLQVRRGPRHRLARAPPTGAAAEHGWYYAPEPRTPSQPDALTSGLHHTPTPTLPPPLSLPKFRYIRYTRDSSAREVSAQTGGQLRRARCLRRAGGDGEGPHQFVCRRRHRRRHDQRSTARHFVGERWRVYGLMLRV